MFKRSISLLTSFIAFSSMYAQSSWNSPQDALDWLNGKIADVRIDVMKYNQNIVGDFSKSTACKFLVSIEQNGLVNSSSNQVFYTEHLNTSTLAPEVKGKYIYLNLNTNNNLKLIKELKQGYNTGFTNSFRLYFDDLQVARHAAEALKYISTSVSAPVPALSSKEDGYAWLQTHVDTVKFLATVVEQKLKIQTDQNNKFLLTITETDSRVTKREYEFYLTDFKAENIRINTTGSRIVIQFTSTGDLKPVKYFLNGAQQNYTNKFELYADDPQLAYQIRDVFVFLTTGKLGGTVQAPKPGVAQQVKTVFEKKDQEAPIVSGGGNNDNISKQNNETAPEPLVLDPFERLGQETIENPDYDNVPMWYDFNAHSLKNLERKNYNTEARSTGMYSSESLIFFDQLASPVIFEKNTIPLFLVKLPSASTDPYSVINWGIATLNKGKNRREFIIGINKVGRSTVSANRVEVEIKKKDAGIYYVKPNRPLPPGEYFFLFEGEGKQVFAFSVK